MFNPIRTMPLGPVSVHSRDASEAPAMCNGSAVPPGRCAPWKRISPDLRSEHAQMSRRELLSLCAIHRFSRFLLSHNESELPRRKPPQLRLRQLSLGNAPLLQLFHRHPQTVHVLPQRLPQKLAHSTRRQMLRHRRASGTLLRRWTMPLHPEFGLHENQQRNPNLSVSHESHFNRRNLSESLQTRWWMWEGSRLLRWFQHRLPKWLLQMRCWLHPGTHPTSVECQNNGLFRRTLHRGTHVSKHSRTSGHRTLRSLFREIRMFRREILSSMVRRSPERTELFVVLSHTQLVN